ncbi:hypothetical protein M5E87_14445 [Flavonifractor plautii]|nr:hypothetical protein M5E87_14445 [Flavonifractor plautii]
MGHSIFPIAAQFTKDYYCLDMTPEAIMAEWLDMARDAYARQVPMKPGTEAFLARCAAAGEPMALLTACVPELCRAALARHGLEGYFRQIIFVQELGLEKRNPEAFTRSLALLGRGRGLHPLRGLPGACRAAQAVGIRAVGCLTPSTPPMRRKCGVLRPVYHQLHRAAVGAAARAALIGLGLRLRPSSCTGRRT